MHVARKRFGQHFLTDRSIIEHIVHSVDPKPGDMLVEIGPGQGAITFPLLKKHGSLTVIEFDRDLLEPLTAAATSHSTIRVIARTSAAATPLRAAGSPARPPAAVAPCCWAPPAPAP